MQWSLQLSQDPQTLERAFEAAQRMIALEAASPWSHVILSQAYLWKKQYEQVWKQGIKDPSTGAVSALPIDQAKEAFLSQQVKARTGPEAQKVYEESKLRFSDASSGRSATDRRR